MKTAARLGIGCAAALALASIGVAVLAPAFLKQAGRVAGQIGRMKRSQSALDDMVDRSAWKRPDEEVLSAAQLDRFFSVRQRIDAARRGARSDLDRLPRKRVRSLEELKQVPAVIEGVSDVVGAEMDAFVAAGMTPAEYHWVERVVYEHWRGALRRSREWPLAWRDAASAIEAAADGESDARVRSRLLAVAAELRHRVPPPPEGFDPGTHALLLSRIDDVERWSLDDLAAPTIPLPR
jgi:hypothetical protein